MRGRAAQEWLRGGRGDSRDQSCTCERDEGAVSVVPRRDHERWGGRGSARAAQPGQRVERDETHWQGTVVAIVLALEVSVSRRGDEERVEPLVGAGGEGGAATAQILSACALSVTLELLVLVEATPESCTGKEARKSTARQEGERERARGGRKTERGGALDDESCARGMQ